jgi:signal transduction histidine kinase
MTTLPMSTGWPEWVPIAPAPGLSSPNIGTSTMEDEQFLLRAFRSFSEAAGSLEQSYAKLRAEVERLRLELEETQSKLRREQALAEISSVLAHEIRNPLGSLELFAGLLAESDLSPDCRNWVEHVQAGLRTLAATVNNVLQFHSRPEPDRSPVDLGQLLGWARDFFLPLARQSRVALSLQNHLSGVFFLADRHGLEQVLLNLVLNSIRALPGGGWIEIGGRPVPNGEAVVLTVSDTGPGIPAEQLPSIFEPGFSTRAGSPGLGLAVCRRIVEQHGGNISASTSRGCGARFTVIFPLNPTRQPAVALIEAGFREAGFLEAGSTEAGSTDAGLIEAGVIEAVLTAGLTAVLTEREAIEGAVTE